MKPAQRTYDTLSLAVRLTRMMHPNLAPAPRKRLVLQDLTTREEFASVRDLYGDICAQVEHYNAKNPEEPARVPWEITERDCMIMRVPSARFVVHSKEDMDIELFDPSYRQGKEHLMKFSVAGGVLQCSAMVKVGGPLESGTLAFVGIVTSYLFPLFGVPETVDVMGPYPAKCVLRACIRNNENALAQLDREPSHPFGDEYRKLKESNLEMGRLVAAL